MVDPSDLLPGLGKELKAHLRPSDEDKDLAYWMVLVMNLAAWGIIMLVFLGALLYVLERFWGVGLRWQFMVVGGFASVALIGVTNYFTGRWVRRHMHKEIREEERRLQEHLRMHNEDPNWHIVINTPEDAEAKRDEIMRLIRPYVAQVVKEEQSAARPRDG